MLFCCRCNIIPPHTPSARICDYLTQNPKATQFRQSSAKSKVDLLWAVLFMLSVFSSNSTTKMKQNETKMKQTETKMKQNETKIKQNETE
jgi:hypothetical protein